jgi:hypothetical protein
MNSPCSLLTLARDEKGLNENTQTEWLQIPFARLSGSLPQSDQCPRSWLRNCCQARTPVLLHAQFDELQAPAEKAVDCAGVFLCTAGSSNS